MIYSFDDLLIKFQGYTDIKGKIRRKVQAGSLIPITRGLYETDPTIDGMYLAGRIYGPSYLSFDFALYMYSLIPEVVYRTYTSATFGKRRAKKYQNHFGVFTYRDVPTEVYPLGVRIIEKNDYSYQIATPEKALCDKLYTISPISNLTELKELLFDDLRIDEEEFKKLDKNTLEVQAPLYHSTNLNLLARFIRRNR